MTSLAFFRCQAFNHPFGHFAADCLLNPHSARQLAFRCPLPITQRRGYWVFGNGLKELHQLIIQSGLETIAWIKQREPKAKILVFTMPNIQAIRAGALGYITKSGIPDVLLAAIPAVYASQLTLSAAVTEALALEKTGHTDALLASLTAREFEILRLLTETLLLNISPKTVANCHYLIKAKLGVSSDFELTRLAIKMDIIDLLALSGRFNQ